MNEEEENSGLSEELKTAINTACNMLTVADLEAMRTGSKSLNLVSNLCDHGGNIATATDLTLRYSQDPNGTKHIIAEAFGEVVSDVVFEHEMKVALAQAGAAGTMVAMADTPAPGPADIAGALVFLGVAGRGLAVAKRSIGVR